MNYRLIGYGLIHPGYFISAIVSSALLKMGAELLTSASLLDHVEHVAKMFEGVTVSLRAQYMEASEVVACSFTQKNPKKVHDTIKGLIEGHGRE